MGLTLARRELNARSTNFFLLLLLSFELAVSILHRAADWRRSSRWCVLVRGRVVDWGGDDTGLDASSRCSSARFLPPSPQSTSWSQPRCNSSPVVHLQIGRSSPGRASVSPTKAIDMIRTSGGSKTTKASQAGTQPQEKVQIEVFREVSSPATYVARVVPLVSPLLKGEGGGAERARDYRAHLRPLFLFPLPPPDRSFRPD